MGYLQEKYTREYFLKEDKFGKPTDFGAEGVESFKKGQVRREDAVILNRINFINKNVLDVGFGRGAALKFAIEKGSKKVIGVDFAPIAKTIAEGFLRKYRLGADLYCDGALEFLKKFKKRYPNIKLDIVLMLDFIEHIPRQELKEIFGILKTLLSKKALLVINTPIYKVDNDIIKEGLKEEAHDSSDDYEMTRGMHCNRYTKKSLAKFMEKLGFIAISGHFFTQDNLQIKKYLRGTPVAWKKAYQDDYPITPDIVTEFFEMPQAISSSSKGINLRKFFNRVKTKYESINIQNLILLFFTLYRSLIKSKIIRNKTHIKERNIQKREINQPIIHHKYFPRWRMIKKGTLRGRYFYIDTYDGYWQREIIEDTYDKFFFDYLDKYDFATRVIFDIGAHIGYHSLKFAEMVKDKGKVYAFEPNQANIQRMQIVLNRNHDLEERIKIFQVALSNKSGRVEFNYNDDIDSGQSSGGYVSSAHVPFSEKNYKFAGYMKKFVNSTSLDNLEKDLNIKDIPSVIKIDVEGAEDLIFEGGKKFIKKYKPLILCEVHSTYCMFKIAEICQNLDYQLELLNQSKDGRCFIAILPNKRFRHHE